MNEAAPTMTSKKVVWENAQTEIVHLRLTIKMWDLFLIPIFGYVDLAKSLLMSLIGKTIKLKLQLEK